MSRSRITFAKLAYQSVDEREAQSSHAQGWPPSLGVKPKMSTKGWSRSHDTTLAAKVSTAAGLLQQNSGPNGYWRLRVPSAVMPNHSGCSSNSSLGRKLKPQC